MIWKCVSYILAIIGEAGWGMDGIRGGEFVGAGPRGCVWCAKEVHNFWERGKEGGT